MKFMSLVVLALSFSISSFAREDDRLRTPPSSVLRPFSEEELIALRKKLQEERSSKEYKEAQKNREQYERVFYPGGHGNSSNNNAEMY